MIYLKPDDKKELLELVAQRSFRQNNGQLLAGGSDLLVKMEHFGLKTGMIVDVKNIKLLAGVTRTQIRSLLRRELAEPVKQFLARARRQDRRDFKDAKFYMTLYKLGFKRAGNPWFEVLVIRDGSVIWKPIELSSGRKTSSVVREISNWIIGETTGPANIKSGQGRHRDTTDIARRWALHVFDGLTPAQIAQQEVSDPDLAENDAENIARQLRAILGQPGG